MNDNDNGLISTVSLLGYFSTILSAEVVAGTALLLFFLMQTVPNYVYFVLIGLAALLTFFGWCRRNDFHQLRMTRGKIRITAFQGFVITILMVGLGCLFAFAALGLLGT